MLGEKNFNKNEGDMSLNSNHAKRSESALGDDRENNVENRPLDWRNIGTDIDANYATYSKCP